MRMMLGLLVVVAVLASAHRVDAQTLMEVLRAECIDRSVAVGDPPKSARARTIVPKGMFFPLDWSRVKDIKFKTVIYGSKSFTVLIGKKQETSSIGNVQLTICGIFSSEKSDGESVFDKMGRQSVFLGGGPPEWMFGGSVDSPRFLPFGSKSALTEALEVGPIFRISVATDEARGVVATYTAYTVIK